MQRLECLRSLAGLLADDDLVVTSLGSTAPEWQSVRPSDANLYQMNMGITTPLSLGLALALPHRRVISLDGDGSLLLILGSLATLGNQRPPNLTVCIFDNESYQVTGGLPTATAGGTDLAGMAGAAGVPRAVTVTDLASFTRAAETALCSDQCSVIVAKVDSTFLKGAATGMDGRESEYRFVRYIERTEGIQIIRTSFIGTSPQ